MKTLKLCGLAWLVLAVGGLKAQDAPRPKDKDPDVAAALEALQKALENLPPGPESEQIKKNLADSKSRLALAVADLEMWKERVAWAERLAKKGFLSNTQFQAEKERLKAAEIALDRAKQEALAQKVEIVAVPKRDFDLRMIVVGDTYQAIRFKPRTGETWLANGTKWEKLAETGDVPAGNYEVVMVGTDKDFIAMRIDHASGTSWLLKNRKWVKMEEPP
jgi:hypothetical protein